MFTENDAYIVGLTGMSGAGKTTACEIFAAEGFGIVNCDLVSRIVVEKGRPALTELKAHFGKAAILSDGSLNRKAIGNLIFSDNSARMAFNKIIYPFISYEMIKTVKSYIDSGVKIILLDAPTLFESGTDDFCNAVVSVVSDKETCLNRIMVRDKLTYEEAANRLKSQFSPDFYLDRSSFCIENRGSADGFKSEVLSIAKKIKLEFIL